MNDKTLGGRIADLRRDKGYSQEYVAEQIGVSRQAVSKWEQNQSAPDTYNLIALAGLLGVTVEYLATGEAPFATPAASPSPPMPPARDPLSTRRVVGYILLTVGLVGFFVGLFMEGVLAVMGGLLVLGGILCLAVRRNFLMVMLWTYWGVCDGLTVLTTGGFSLLPIVSTGGEITRGGLFMLLLAIWLVVNIIVTVCLCVRKRRTKTET